MNYLAHAYLSFNNSELLVGNMISDFVKGRKKDNYPDGIRNGITLHRLIDEYTDNHPATKEARGYFRTDYRLYSGAFTDIVYDHFLSIDQNIFTQQQLEEFTRVIYGTLDSHIHLLPENFSMMFPFMKQHNWLYNYQYRWGIERSFAGLVHRAAYMHSSDSAVRTFEKHYDDLRKLYTAFFPDLKNYALERIYGFNPNSPNAGIL